MKSEICDLRSLERFRYVQHLLRAGSYPIVLSQVHPTDDAGWINEEFRWSGDIVPVLSGACMHEIVASNCLKVRIRKKRERVTGFLCEAERYLRCIYANRDGPNTLGTEVTQPLLNAPQLGVTQGSPIASIKDKQHSLGRLAINWRRQKLRKRDLLVFAVSEGEVGSLLTNVWCATGLG